MMTQHIPTYLPQVNTLLSGGLPLPGLVEVFGDEGSGKTGMALSLSQAHPMLFIDLDGTFPHHLAHRLGKAEAIRLIELEENSASAIQALLAHVTNLLVVLDPVGVLPKKDLRRLVPHLFVMAQRQNLCIVMVNHANVLGNPAAHSTMEVYASQRVELRLKEEIKERQQGKTQTVGMKIAVRCMKDTHGIFVMHHATEDIYFEGER